MSNLENKSVIVENENEKGASMLEYALMAALIAVVAIAAVTFLGQQASVTFSGVGQQMADAPGNN
jgi:pilus assembly protein Flp/PilA